MYRGDVAMKRILLICVIIGLCGVVAISGNITLVNSNGVLKKQEKTIKERIKYHIMVDVSDKRLFLMKNNEVENSFPIAVGSNENPSPVGHWKATKESHDNKGKKLYWINLSVPWGKYAIYGTDYYKAKMYEEGSIKLFSEDFAELYNKLDKEASVYIYGSEVEQIYKSVEPGDKGVAVYEVENRLRTLCYYVGKIDGIYDKELEAAVHKFQKSCNLSNSDKIEMQFYKKLGVVMIE
jgi:hypothetical protein